MTPRLAQKLAQFDATFRFAHWLPITDAYTLGVHAANMRSPDTPRQFYHFYQHLTDRLQKGQHPNQHLTDRLQKGQHPTFAAQEFVFDHATDFRLQTGLNTTDNLVGYLCTRLARSGHFEQAWKILESYPISRQYRLYDAFYSDLHSQFDTLDIGFISLFSEDAQVWPETIKIIEKTNGGRTWLKDHFEMLIKYLVGHESLARGLHRNADTVALPNAFKKARNIFLKKTFDHSYTALHHLLKHYPQTLTSISTHKKWEYLFSIEQYDQFIHYPFFQELLSSPELLHQLVIQRLSGQRALGEKEKEKMQKIIAIAEKHGNLNVVIDLSIFDSKHARAKGGEHNAIETAVLHARNIHQHWLQDFLTSWMAAGGEPRIKFNIPGIKNVDIETYFSWFEAGYLMPLIRDFRMRNSVNHPSSYLNINVKKI